ncbi:hypothetical protein M8818_006602 [Zalaria obscura]|uniref:Uncharacterized protein n=1 Tax=Zalaria obscura TaxID=2024903 RepID=A0ACC3S6R1_9PEZI
MAVDTMKAVRFHGRNDLRFEHIPEPTCGKDQIKVSKEANLHEYLGGPGICPTTPHPITKETIPLTFGHEFSGTIEEIGSDIKGDFKVGDRVAVQPIIYDGTCGACKEGLPNCCYNNGFVGLSGWGGGLSEHLVVPEYCVIKIPDNVSLEIAALVEPLSVGWHAVKISPFKPNDYVLILGGGPIGLSVIQALRARGSNCTIIVSEVSAKRKDYAKQFGADHVLDPTVDDVVARCREIADGVGVHEVFDCAGVQAGLDAAIHAVRARGTVVNIAVWEKACSIHPNDVMFKERKYLGVATYVLGDFKEVIDAISEGRMKPEAMITKRIELEEVVEEGFKALVKDKDNQVKILVKAWGGN